MKYITSNNTFCFHFIFEGWYNFKKQQKILKNWRMTHEKLETSDKHLEHILRTSPHVQKKSEVKNILDLRKNHRTTCESVLGIIV